MGAVEGLWLWPRLETASAWLLSDPLPADLGLFPADFQFEGRVALIGYRPELKTLQPGETAVITLYWQPLAPISENAAVFLHLLDEAGNLVAQDDGPPVGGAYPLTVWQPGTVIADEREIILPQDLPAGSYTLAVGLYDPRTFGRWAITDADGQAVPDNRALLAAPVRVNR